MRQASLVDTHFFEDKYRDGGNMAWGPEIEIRLGMAYAFYLFTGSGVNGNQAKNCRNPGQRYPVDTKR
jgi:hypothetical protein